MEVYRQDLRHAFQAFVQMPFPPDSDDDEVSELHARLAEYDGHVAGLVQTVLGGGQVDRSMLRPDPDLKRHLERIVTGGRREAAADAWELLEYVNGLEDLLKLAEAEGSQ